MAKDPKVTATFCGSCHQANWPLSLRSFRPTDQPMQDTLAEFQRARVPQRSCQACHMPTGSHRFRGGHDVAWLRKTISARVSLDAHRRLQIIVAARGVGHKFPTGDPFRRLQLDVCAQATCDDLLLAFSFGRFFQNREGRQVLVRDTALPAPENGRPAERRITYPLTSLPNAGTLYWRLRYSYAAPSTEADLEDKEVAVELAQGRVERADTPPHGAPHG